MRINAFGRPDDDGDDVAVAPMLDKAGFSIDLVGGGV
jgi:hypothetical protein